MSLTHSGSDVILRVEIDKDKSTFGEIAAAIERAVAKLSQLM